MINSLRGDAVTRIVYRRTDGRTDRHTDNGVSHKLDWSQPVELINVQCWDGSIWFIVVILLETSAFQASLKPHKENFISNRKTATYRSNPSKECAFIPLMKFDFSQRNKPNGYTYTDSEILVIFNLQFLYDLILFPY